MITNDDSESFLIKVKHFLDLIKVDAIEDYSKKFGNIKPDDNALMLFLLDIILLCNGNKGYHGNDVALSIVARLIHGLLLQDIDNNGSITQNIQLKNSVEECFEAIIRSANSKIKIKHLKAKINIDFLDVEFKNVVSIFDFKQKKAGNI